MKPIYVILLIVGIVGVLLLLYFFVLKKKETTPTTTDMAKVNTPTGTNTTTPTGTNTTTPTGTNTSQPPIVVSVPTNLTTYAHTADNRYKLGLLGTNKGIAIFDTSNGSTSLITAQEIFSGFLNNDTTKPIKLYQFSLPMQFYRDYTNAIFDIRNEYKNRFLQSYEEANNVKINPSFL